MDLRRTNRYRVSAPAFFCWEHPNGNLQQAKGTTRDISATGVFVAADRAPSPGLHIELDVGLAGVEWQAQVGATAR